MFYSRNRVIHWYIPGTEESTGIRMKKIAARACLYNTEIRILIISLERYVCPPGAKGRPWIDSFERRLRVLGCISFQNTRARPHGVSS